MSLAEPPRIGGFAHTSGPYWVMHLDEELILTHRMFPKLDEETDQRAGEALVSREFAVGARQHLAEGRQHFTEGLMFGNQLGNQVRDLRSGRGLVQFGEDPLLFQGEIFKDFLSQHLLEMFERGAFVSRRGFRQEGFEALEAVVNKDMISINESGQLHQMCLLIHTSTATATA